MEKQKDQKTDNTELSHSPITLPFGESKGGVELRSEEVQEVLGAIPHWILRWGIVVLSAIVLVLFIGSWFFKYPDTIAATMTLTGATPPAALVAKTNGQLTELLIRDGQEVKKGDYLAVIQNPARTCDMLSLKKHLERAVAHPDSVSYIPYEELKLGSVQGIYTSFMRSLNTYKQFIALDYYPRKIASINQRIIQYEQYAKNMGNQQVITEQQHRIAGVQYGRDSLLNKRDVLSEEDLNQAQSQYLQSRLSLETSKSTQENLQIQITQMRETLLDTEQQYQDRENTLESDLTTLGTQLMNEITTWELTYVLLAPIHGRVTFTGYWSENQNITAGETVFTVIPNESQGLVGKALLPVMRSGKVKPGQQVNIYFLNYPDEEFGMVRGKVKNISLVPVKDNYTVEVVLHQGLLTSYKKELPFAQEMTANVEIITEDLCLLERFFLPLKKIFKEHL